MVDWTETETLLVLDAYFRLGTSTGNLPKEEVVALAEFVHHSEGSVARLVANFHSQANPGGGLEQASRLSKTLYARWVAHPQELANVAATLRRVGIGSGGIGSGL